MSGRYRGKQRDNEVPPGSRHYRAFVGPTDTYDQTSAMQLNLMTALGMRENHYLLDIGCGSLRAGRLFIPYLLPGHYFGLEPEQWLIDAAIENELGKDLIEIKRPVFSNNTEFNLSVFARDFDFLIAQSIFSHAPQSQIKKCLSEVRKVMKPTSVFAATFLQGDDDYAGDKWVYPECVRYTLEHMISLARDYDLHCEPIDWPHPNTQTWILMVSLDSAESISHLGNTTKSQHLLLLEEKLRYKQQRLAKIEL